MIKKLLIAIAGPALVAGSPNAMSVATFLEKSQALEARGASAWLSPDRKRLQREAQAAFDEWVRQARPPVACPPKGRAFRGDPHKFLAMLRAVPADQRARISVREAFRREWNSRWPCRRSRAVAPASIRSPVLAFAEGMRPVSSPRAGIEVT